MTNDELYDYLKNDHESLALLGMIFAEYIVGLGTGTKQAGLSDFFTVLDNARCSTDTQTKPLTRLLHHVINDYALEHCTDKT